MKKIIVVILTFFAISFMAGCGNKQIDSSKKDDAVMNTAKENKQQEISTVDGAIEKLKSSGFSLGEKKETYYHIIGAYDGTKIDLNNDVTLEIYQYKDGQKDAKEKAKETMATADSIIFENNSLLVVVHSRDIELANNLENSLK